MRNVFYLIILTVGVDVAETAGKYWNDRAPPFYCSQITFLQLTISCDEILINTEFFIEDIDDMELSNTEKLKKENYILKNILDNTLLFL